METKHTAGPWEYGEGSGACEEGSEWYVSVQNDWIAEIFPTTHGSAEANARLMAAAPLLLEALEMAFDKDLTYLSGSAMINQQDVVRARLAIRAALGTTV